MDHKIRQGLAIKISGAPEQAIRAGNRVSSVGIPGADYPGMRPEILVEIGQKLDAGAPVFRDRKRPEIVVTSPIGGTVRRIDIGPRRQLSMLVIAADHKGLRKLSTRRVTNRTEAQALLLEGGLWPSIRQRPFGHIPDPGAVPDAIFVTAMDAAPLAADPGLVLAELGDAFRHGVVVLQQLTDGPVFICQGPGPALMAEGGQISVEKFLGGHLAGLAGTHVDRLFPVTGNRRVWQVNYQDVAAIGHLLETGMPPDGRIISLAGPGVANPRLLRVPLGASLDELVAGELKDGSWNVMSGPPVGGLVGAYLRRHHWQVSVMPRVQSKSPRPRRLWGNGPDLRPAAIVPTRAIELSLGPEMAVVPLIRALGCGDVEAADRLGCRGLLEEDLAMLTYAIGGAPDLAGQLRRVLDVLEEVA